jgi:hypothetical protein
LEMVEQTVSGWIQLQFWPSETARWSSIILKLYIVVNGLRWRHPAWLASRMEGHGGRPSHFICLINNQPQRLTIRIWTSNFWIRNYRVESASPK